MLTRKIIVGIMAVLFAVFFGVGPAFATDYSHYLNFYQLRYGSDMGTPLPEGKVDFTIGNSADGVIRYPYLNLTYANNPTTVSRTIVGEEYSYSEKIYLYVTTLLAAEIDANFMKYGTDPDHIKLDKLQRADIEKIYVELYTADHNLPEPNQIKYGITVDENWDPVLDEGNVIADSTAEQYREGKTVVLPFSYSDDHPAGVFYNMNNPAVAEYCVRAAVQTANYCDVNGLFFDNYGTIGKLIPGAEADYFYDGSDTENFEHYADKLAYIGKEAKFRDADLIIIANGLLPVYPEYGGPFLDELTSPNNIDCLDGMMSESVYSYYGCSTNVDFFLDWIDKFSDYNKMVLLCPDRDYFSTDVNDANLWNFWYWAHLVARDNVYFWASNTTYAPMIDYNAFSFPLGCPDDNEPVMLAGNWVRKYERGIIVFDTSSGGQDCINMYPNVVYVDCDASGANDGTSWQDAYTDLQDAINASFDGSTIWVAPGIYKGTDNRDIDFQGRAIKVRSIDPNDWDVVAATVIDCNGSRNDPHCGFYFHNSEDNNSIIDGLTITNGYGRYIAFDDMYTGGAILCSYGSNPTIRRCILTGNMNDKVNSNTYGGAIACYAESSTNNGPLIEDCNIYDNEAYYGGGISTVSVSPTIRNCMVWDNEAVRGGGIDLFWASSVDINNCTIVNNSASTGGGINSNNSTETITNCILWGNGDDLYDCNTTYSCIQDGDAGTGNISSDPCFVGADANDFHLKSTSPCIDIGDPNGNYACQTDIDGGLRVMLGRVDIGADETSYSYAHWWNLDDGSGATADDFIGDANGTFNGDDPCWTDGLIGGAVDFNGVNDYFSVSSMDSAYSNSSVFTVAGWFKTSQSAGIQTIAGQWTQDDQAGYEYYGWQVLVENGKVAARFGNETNVYDVTGTKTVNDGNDWHHFVMVRNGTNSVALYVDGNPDGTAGTINFLVYNTKFRIGDGSDRIGNPPMKGGPFNGMIDDVMIYNKALSAGEVEQLYEAGLEE